MPDIRPLADRPDLVPTVAGWLYHQFGHLNPGASLERAVARVSERLRTQGSPMALIALDNGQPVGTASLIDHDCEDRPDLSPWLASVYVRPEWRRTGLGSQLCRAVAGHARASGHERIYLFTPDMQPFFATMGWQELQTQRHHGRVVSVMVLWQPCPDP